MPYTTPSTHFICFVTTFTKVVFQPPSFFQIYSWINDNIQKNCFSGKSLEHCAKLRSMTIRYDGQYYHIDILGNSELPSPGFPLLIENRFYNGFQCSIRSNQFIDIVALFLVLDSLFENIGTPKYCKLI